MTQYLQTKNYVGNLFELCHTSRYPLALLFARKKKTGDDLGPTYMTAWVVGRSTETVDSSPSTESMDSWAAALLTELVDFSLS